MSNWTPITGVIQFTIFPEHREFDNGAISSSFLNDLPSGQEGSIKVIMNSPLDGDVTVLTIYGALREANDSICEDVLKWLNESCHKLNKMIEHFYPYDGFVICQHNDLTTTMYEFDNYEFVKLEL